MDAFSTILHASLTGSVNFLTFIAGGAAISHLGHWGTTISTNLAAAIFKVFLPALLFGPVLETAYNTRVQALQGTQDAASMQEILIPFFSSVIILTLTSLFAYALAWLVARNKAPIVRALIWATITIGNNNLVLVVSQPLCETFPPMMRDPKCFSNMTVYNALFSIPSTVFTWAVAYPYLQSASEKTINPHGEKAPLLPSHAGPSSVSSSEKTAAKQPKMNFIDALVKAVVNPPTMTMVAAAIIACLPFIPELFLGDGAPLNTMLTSLNSLGLLTVYFSPVVVGAEVYQALSKKRSSGAPIRERPELRFGHTAIASITLVRLVIIPVLGRQIYNVFNMREWIQKPSLGLFVLEQTNVNTANMAMLMVALLGDSFQRTGDVVRKDVANVLFLQFLMAPILLTLNTALAIAIQYPH